MPYVGEIRMFGGSFEPKGWLFCDGRSLPIAENDTLYNLIGTTYGGDGEVTFNLPNLQSRVPIHQGSGGEGSYILGETGGVEEVTLTVTQIPIHTHTLAASTKPGASANPDNNFLAQTPASITLYIEDAPSVNLHTSSLAPVGGSQPHENMQPTLAVNYIISLYGVFPPPQ
jgi:microcystin-dependent protein